MAWYRAGGGGIPSSLKTGMDSVLNKKFGTSTTYPAEDWPDTVNLMGPLPEKTVSGAIVTFPDGADGVPLKKCEITLPASLDGYSQVDVVHTGKNLLPMVNYDGGVYNPDIGRQLNFTVSETQFTKNGNVYSVNTSVSWKTHTVLFPIISGATYYEKWTLSVESGQQGSTRAYLDEDFKVLARYNSNSSDPIVTNGVMTPPTGAKYLAITWTNRGTAVQTLNITEPMIEIGSSASAWEEYNGTTHTASLGRTIYGGTADVVNGTGSEKYKLYTASDVTSLYWNAKKAEQVDTNHRASFRIALSSGYITVNNSLCNELSYSQSIASGSGAYEGYQLIATAGIYFCIDLSDIGMENATSSTPDEDFLAAIRNYGDNLKFVVELATPTDFTFTPITPTPETALGTNNFWADSGDSIVTYRADINLALGGQ